MKLASVVIRTLNEERYLEQLLSSICNQKLRKIECEIVVIDSGSTDRTLAIAQKYGARIAYIKKQEFTFGRSLNRGCEFARGQFLVFVSGHCVPTDDNWLENLCAPLVTGQVQYCYGRQVGGEGSKFSELKIFDKYFPSVSQIPQQGFFCNNANAAVLRSEWEKHRFNEELTGLEDLYLAKTIVSSGGRVGYAADSVVYHFHHESWRQVKRRYEREAIALQRIMPEIQLNFIDILRYIVSGVFHDFGDALSQKVFYKNFLSIILFRTIQYYGSYKGNHEHRILSKRQKEQYFYPKEI